MKVPLNTYRLQFNKNFTFNDLKEIIPYLNELGVDCIYASPIFKAVPGSTHGYDQTDPHQINPEIGTLNELKIIKREMAKNNIKWIQDIIPNHMAFHKENYWLMDVLEKKKESEFWNFFDINWHHPFYKGKLMVPVLNETLEEAVRNQKISLKLTDNGICIDYNQHSFPASITSYKFLIESANSLTRKVLSIINRDDEIQENLNKFSRNEALLKEFLRLQNFELVYWQESDKQINYRRFFTINSLICLKMELETVFNHYHKFIFQLLKEEIFDGLRIDHIDGLLEPDIYLERLRDIAGKDIYIVVEKILCWNESLPHNWPVQGTTGYDFLANVNGLLTKNNLEPLKRTYRSYTNKNIDYDKASYKNRYCFLEKHMYGDLQNLFFILKEILPDADINSLAAILSAMSVYRLYPNKNGLSHSEKNIIIKAAEVARANMHSVMNDELLKLMLEGKGDQWLYFMQRFQQLSGPLAAKGIEDTTFYQYNLLISHNEVGDNPESNNYSIKNFTDFIIKRNNLGLNATATHDTKRGEDARARINVISEFPEEWQRFLAEVNEINKDFIGVLPDKNDLYFLYQTLIGSYPCEKQWRGDYEERLTNYIIKVVREGKQKSDWAKPNESYEQIIKRYVTFLLTKIELLSLFEKVFTKFSFLGSLNSLSQLVLKCTLPGVTDFYQGCELWDLSFVDPDNRRTVNFDHRGELIKKVAGYGIADVVNKFLKNSNDPEVKLYFVYKLLNNRLENKDLFHYGNFELLESGGEYKENTYAFKRVLNDKEVLVVCGRLLSSVYKKYELQNNLWGNTEINSHMKGHFIDIFTCNTFSVNGKIPVNDLFSFIPVSVLMKK